MLPSKYKHRLCYFSTLQRNAVKSDVKNNKTYNIDTTKKNVRCRQPTIHANHFKLLWTCVYDTGHFQRMQNCNDILFAAALMTVILTHVTLRCRDLLDVHICIVLSLAERRFFALPTLSSFVLGQIDPFEWMVMSRHRSGRSRQAVERRTCHYVSFVCGPLADILHARHATNDRLRDNSTASSLLWRLNYVSVIFITLVVIAVRTSNWPPSGPRNEPVFGFLRNLNSTPVCVCLSACLSVCLSVCLPSVRFLLDR